MLDKHSQIYQRKKPMISLRTWTPIASWAMAVAFGTVALPALLTGCGGSSHHDDGTGTLLQGNAAVRSAAIAGYQSLGAGISYPFAALQRSAPANSAISRAVAITTKKRIGTTRAEGNLTYDSFLNLYVGDAVTSGNKMTVPYFTDASGTTSAGTLSISTPDSATYNTAYTTYPAHSVMTANLTAGNLPCTGSVTITYQDASGANTMSGTLTLPKNSIALDIHLALDPQENVTGSAIVRESGATLTLSNVAGNLGDTLSGAVAVTPYGWTGQASLNLSSGAFSVTLNTGNGATASATQNTDGSLGITYPDATTESVLSPLTATLVTAMGSTTGGSTTGGSTTGGSTGGDTASENSYQVANSFSYGDTIGIHSINTNGAMVQQFGDKAVYYASPKATAQTLATPPDYPSASPEGINASNQIVGFYSERLNGPQGSTGAYWDSPSAQPVPLPIPAGYTSAAPVAINDRGEIVGTAYVAGRATKVAVYWAHFDAVPVVLGTRPGADTSTTRGINNNGVIIGQSPIDESETGPEPRAIVWTSPTSAPIVLPNASSADMSTGNGASAINDSNEIVGGVVAQDATARGVLWTVKDGTVQAPVVLPVAPGDSYTYPQSINNAGVIVGYSNNIGAIWRKNSDGSYYARHLSTLLETGNTWNIDDADHISNNGVLSGLGNRQSAAGDHFILVLTPK